ncbi:hypothetical protein KFL_011090030 [Klebsormidium nitens]|uniref:SWIM-type domain-containing protein n=1 Tax=Klebsormidium nitens TaxID=105231 RepID=A0A1Y1IPV1_KLENI|nr:hypothetical protein KFL_011090030 [Klebsormidium nitens]|eukprot:GAQ92724.1 hypothetical protein KFL_011090030 [Klebsormidium nitens]
MCGAALRSGVREEQSQASPTDARNADGRLTIAAQAARFIIAIRSGQCILYSVGEEESLSTVYLATAWDHNNARSKPLGRPSKVRALLETVYWDTMGRTSCTCDRGRLYFDAPCVHKLALQALEPSRLASHVSLPRGARVVEVPCEEAVERVFGVYWNAGSPSPQRTMVHYSATADFFWYCEGRQDGCSRVADCGHIQEAKRALERKGGMQRLAGSFFSNEQLKRGLGSVGQDGLSGGALHQSNVDSEAPSCMQRNKEGATDLGLEKYMAELIVGGHHEATCKGDSCFCKQHARLFGGVKLDTGGQQNARHAAATLPLRVGNGLDRGKQRRERGTFL